MTLRRASIASVAGLALVGVTACGGGSSTTHGSSGSSSPSSSNAAKSSGSSSATSSQSPVKGDQAVPKGLEKFYEQKLDWRSCEEGECAWLKVPLDYTKPTGQTIDVAVNRKKSSGKAEGSLIINPGGPGASGIDYAAQANEAFTPAVRKSFDIVGFDPRGVKRSAAITCVSDAQMDAEISKDPTPDTEAEKKAAVNDHTFADACKKNAGPLLGHVSTKEVAQDMDVLRAALGDEKINYFGASYGTSLGAIYAENFPKNVGRMVLDGVLPPSLTTEQVTLGQAKGFQTALNAYAENCARKKCSLGSSPAKVIQSIQDLFMKLDQHPIKAEGDDRLNTLNEGWAFYGVAAALYSQQSWPLLTQALENARDGDGTDLLDLGKMYAERNDDGTYSGNIMQILPAVNCLDDAGPRLTEGEYNKMEAELNRVSPFFGKGMMAGSGCEGWPVKATSAPHKIKDDGIPPLLLIGTTRDPATPYEWTKILLDQLPGSRMVTRDGDGHTGYNQGNNCVNETVENYLIKGDVPKSNVTCS